ncbi:MAG: hypothetical protein M1818_001673 [Claussenomyces sp. TS43310]|nr:MAG: hypothetical protein M1818_001673 [Claussenomyces sp. TS43310]
MVRYTNTLLSVFIACCITASYGLIFNSTALIIAVDKLNADKGSYLLNSYGIDHDDVIVPESGCSLPALETSSGGNYGLIIVVSQVQYNDTTVLTDTQWNSLYDYQTKYGVRMVQLYVVPGEDFGVQQVAPCCQDTVEQNVTLVADGQTNHFPTAGLRVANMSSIGLYHFGASILDANSSSTNAVFNFLPNSVIDNTTVAAVINNLPSGRQQFVTFMDAGNWSETSTIMNHAWVQWGYRGLYQGFRRIIFGTQVDDLFLQTVRYSTDVIFRLRAPDLYEHVQWTYDINRRVAAVNNGSSYFTEFGFNANGNLIFDYSVSTNITSFTCENPVFTDWSEPTSLEFVKPLGAGIDKWPTYPQFHWTAECVFLDPLAQFLSNITNRDAIGLVSHTFTHLELNEATYHDTLREIQYNLMYGELLNLTNAAKFSGGGLIPPAITGMHNGDALRAFTDNGLWNAIGDNTRPSLRNPNGYHYPLITSVLKNGFDGYQITPRFATRVYYNCDIKSCDVEQWIDTEDGTAGGTIYTLLQLERANVGNQLLSLFHDPYMFHQPNLRVVDVEETLINGKMQQLSLIQMWVETVTSELMRLVTWPIITLKHDHIALSFRQRMILDECEPYFQYTTSSNSDANSTQNITGFTVGSSDNNCELPIPVTIPGELEDTKDFRIEQIGTDPATIWVELMGTPQSFVLASPVAL